MLAIDRNRRRSTFLAAALDDGRFERAITEGAISEGVTADSSILHFPAQQSGCEV